MATSLGLVLLFSPCSAPAQPKESPAEVAKNRDAARALATKGLELMGKKKYADAIAHFEKAEARFHAPTHLLFMARAYRQMGKWISAKKHYQAVIGENIPNYAPDAFHKAQADAGKELSDLSLSIPKFRILVQGGAADSVDVRVDGQRAEWQAGPVEVDPGEHIIEAVSKSGNEQSRTLKIEASDVLEVRFEFAGGEPAKGSDQAGRNGSGAEPGPLWPALLSFGVGALGVGAGAAFGVLSFSKVDQLKELCPNNRCPASAVPVANDGRFFGNLSTVGFVLGGAGIVTGTIFAIVRPFGNSAAAAFKISPQLGIGSAGVSGQF